MTVKALLRLLAEVLRRLASITTSRDGGVIRAGSIITPKEERRETPILAGLSFPGEEGQGHPQTVAWPGLLPDSALCEGAASA